MDTLLEDLKTFFSRLNEDEEGKKVFSYVDHSFLLKVSGAGNFFLKREGQGFSVEKGEVPDLNWRRITTVDTDEEMLRAVMAGKVRPSAALYSTRLRMDGMASNKAYNHGLLRLLRRGAELNKTV